MKKFLLGSAILSLMLWACGGDSSSAPENTSGDEPTNLENELPPDTTCCKENIYSSSVASGKSSAVTPESSSSVDAPESSSSADAPESSSSRTEKNVQVADDVFGTCLKTGSSEFLDGGECPEGASCQRPVTDWALPPVAYMTLNETSDSAAIIVENVSLSCMAISGTKSMVWQTPVSNAEITASGDTLYMNLTLDSSAVENECRCQSRVIFKIAATPAFTNASLLVFVNGDDVGNRMQIVKDQSPVVGDSVGEEQDSIPESTPTDLELTGFERGQCQNDDLAAKPLAKTAATELPEARLITYMNGETVLTLENVMDYCGIDAKVSQKMSGDTLMLAYYDQTGVTKCICNFDKIEFLIEPENAAAKYVKFKDVVYWVNEIRYVVDPDWDN